VHLFAQLGVTLYLNAGLQCILTPVLHYVVSQTYFHLYANTGTNIAYTTLPPNRNKPDTILVDSATWCSQPPISSTYTVLQGYSYFNPECS
jgi:hypothetical protein